MRLEAGNFNTEISPIQIYNDSSSAYTITEISWSDPNFPVPPALTYTDLDVPIGSTIGFMLYTYRSADWTTGCRKREVNAATAYVYFTALQSYTTVENWFLANLSAITATFSSIQNVQMTVSWQSVQNLSNAAMNTFVSNNASSDDMRLYINRDPSDNKLTFWMSGTIGCGSSISNTTLKFSLQRTTIEPDFIFETLPIDALPDVFFENNLSFTISGGQHNGNVQNQNFF